MYTPFGKYIRVLRIGRMTLKEMAESLGVSSAFLSSVETGRKNVPKEWANRIAQMTELEGVDINKLCDVINESVPAVKLDLRGSSDSARRLAVAFSRKFDDLDDEQVAKLFESLGGNTE